LQQAGNAFNWVLGVQDNASKTLDTITRRADKVHAASLNAANSLQKLGEELQDPIKGEVKARDPKTGRYTTSENTLIAQKGTLIQKMGVAGMVSAGQLNKLALSLDLLAVESPRAAEKLRDASARIRKLGIDSTMAADKTGSAAKRMSFMGDVSDDTAMAMRRVSAASQGLMLSMSLLDKNFIGIAFSLIFLQFSGFLKLSLVMAGVTLAAGVALKVFKKFMDETKRVKELKQALSLITGSMEAGNVVRERAGKIVEGLGIKEDKAKHFTKGLEQAMMQLRFRGFEPTTEALDVFVKAMAIEMQILNKSPEEATQSAMAAMLSFAKSGLALDITLGDATLSMENFGRMGAAAIADLSTTMSNTAEDYKKDVGSMLQDNAAAGISFERQTEAGQDALTRNMAIQEGLEEAFAASGRGVENTNLIIAAAFGDLSSVAAEKAPLIVADIVSVDEIIDDTAESILGFTSMAKAEFPLASNEFEKMSDAVIGYMGAVQEEMIKTSQLAGVLFDPITGDVMQLSGARPGAITSHPLFGNIQDSSVTVANQLLEAFGTIFTASQMSIPRIGPTGSGTGVVVNVHGTIVTANDLTNAVTVTTNRNLMNVTNLDAAMSSGGIY
jgi:hypothetical protein